MTVVAELTIPASEFVLGETLSAVPDATAEFERIVTHSQEWIMPFLWVRNRNFERFDRAIRRDSTVENAEIAERFDGTRLYRVEWTAEVTDRVNVIFDRTGTLLEATGCDDRWEILVRFDGKRAFAEIQEHFDRSDTAFTLRRILTGPSRDTAFDVSPEQREALVTAVEMGYYDIPRGTTPSAVAERLDITTSAASERLRRAISSLTERALLVDRETGASEWTESGGTVT